MERAHAQKTCSSPLFASDRRCESSAAISSLSAATGTGSISGAGTTSASIKATLPLTQVLHALSQKGAEGGGAKEYAIDDVVRKTQRLFEVDEQHRAEAPRFVPRFVFVGVVEDENAAFLPLASLGTDSDTHPVVRFGNDQAEMQAEHAVVGPAMRRNPLARIQDREHGRPQAGDAPNNAPRLGTPLDVQLRSDAVGRERKNLPAGVAGNACRIRREVLHVRQFRLALEHA